MTPFQAFLFGAGVVCIALAIAEPKLENLIFILLGSSLIGAAMVHP